MNTVIYLFAAVPVAFALAVLFVKRGFGVYNYKPDLKGKTILVTGGNTGIGLETAKELAKLGGRVIIACRDEKRGRSAKNDVLAYCNHQEVSLALVDLADMSSIRSCVEHLQKKGELIDILVNNAGVMLCPKMLTKDNLEMQIGTNHFGHFLFTVLLLNKNMIKPKGRIVNVSSSAHTRGKMKWDDIRCPVNYSSINAYAQSKLANVLFSRELNRRLVESGSTIRSYCLHPGVVRTELTRFINNGWMKLPFLMIYPVFWLFTKSPLEGAQTTIYCAIAPELEGKGGLYYVDCRETSTSRLGLNDDDAQKLWKISEEIVGCSLSL